MTKLLSSDVVNAIINSAKAQANHDARVKESIQDAIRVYMTIDTYEALKEANSLFNEVYTSNALNNGIDEKTAISRCKAAMSYIRGQAKKLGWEQPSNPNAKPKKSEQEKSVVVKQEVSDDDGNSVKAEVILDDDTILRLVGMVTMNLPKTVYSMLFTKTGELKASLLGTPEASALSKQTKEELDKHINEIISELKARLTK